MQEAFQNFLGDQFHALSVLAYTDLGFPADFVSVEPNLCYRWRLGYLPFTLAGRE